MKKSIKKAIVIAMTSAAMAAITIPAFAESTNSKEMIVSDQYASAHINAGGNSGTIDIIDTSIWDKPDGLTSIADIPLKEITNGTGCTPIESIELGKSPSWWLFSNKVSVKCVGGIKMYFTDETDDTYSLEIYLHSPFNTHDVTYNSSSPKIKKITWETIYRENSWSGDEAGGATPIG